MKARIYKPSRTATQSGRGLINEWMLEYEPSSARRPEPLMGWVASADTNNQVRIEFPTLEDAEAFAERLGLDYTVQAPRARRVKPRNYGDNFKYVKIED